jgi:nucleotide-binding universal stress UspA family protein
MDTMTSIVVGIDFSEGSAAALREALRLGAWNRAAVRAVHVIDTLVAVELQEAMAGFQ